MPRANRLVDNAPVVTTIQDNPALARQVTAVPPVGGVIELERRYQTEQPVRVDNAPQEIYAAIFTNALATPDNQPMVEVYTPNTRVINRPGLFDTNRYTTVPATAAYQDVGAKYLSPEEKARMARASARTESLIILAKTLGVESTTEYNGNTIESLNSGERYHTMDIMLAFLAKLERLNPMLDIVEQALKDG